jgi:hypothetical protein
VNDETKTGTAVAPERAGGAAAVGADAGGTATRTQTETAPPGGGTGTGGGEGEPHDIIGGASSDKPYALFVVIGGFVALVAIFAFAVFKQDDAKDVVTITGPAFAVISGLVGAYFGLRAGSLAAQRVVDTVHPPKKQKRFNPDSKPNTRNN